MAVATSARAREVPPTGLVIVGIMSVQIGSAIAKHLFHSLGPGGAVFLRVGFGAIMLLALGRLRLKGYRRADYALAALFGLTVAFMNLSFYSALARIPLGIAVTFEFIGPLGVAVAGSRRLLDLLWVLLAGVGIVLLTPWGGLKLDPVGVGFAFLAGGFWAGYILLGARVGRAFPGGAGLAFGMAIGGLALAPIGIANAGSSLLDPKLLAGGCVIGFLSSVVPYSLELQALRKLPTQLFGVLMSMEPAAAALMGFVLLREVLALRAIVAIVLVVVAAAGASRFRPPPISP